MALALELSQHIDHYSLYFRVECIYTEPMKTVTVPLAVSMLPTALVTQRQEMPVCSYQVPFLR